MSTKQLLDEGYKALTRLCEIAGNLCDPEEESTLDELGKHESKLRELLRQYDHVTVCNSEAAELKEGMTVIWRSKDVSVGYDYYNIAILEEIHPSQYLVRLAAPSKEGNWYALDDIMIYEHKAKEATDG